MVQLRTIGKYGSACIRKITESLQSGISQQIIDNTLHLSVQQKIAEPYTKVAQYDLKQIEIIGHRGCGKEVFSIKEGIHENTLESFKLAHLRGAQMVEMDLHMTKDKRIVIYHDDFLHKNRDLMISQLTLDEFHEVGPTLNQVLDQLPDDLALYLEIKYSHSLEYPEGYASELVMTIIDLLSGYPNKKILLASFSPMICVLVKTYVPVYKVCLLINEEERSDCSLRDLCVDGIVCDTAYVPKISTLIEDAKLGGMALLCYGGGCNDPLEIQKLKEMGFTGFCTDNLALYK